MVETTDCKILLNTINKKQHKQLNNKRKKDAEIEKLREQQAKSMQQIAELAKTPRHNAHNTAAKPNFINDSNNTWERDTTIL